MPDQGHVIDLRTRSTYQPDCATLARNRLALARQSMNLTRSELAAMLTPLVGWPVTPEAVEAWETTLIPPGDILVAVSTATPTSLDRIAARSHKFIAGYIGAEAAQTLAGDAVTTADLGCWTIPVPHPSGMCRLYAWPFGVAIFHLVEDLDLPTIGSLAVWRYRSYEANLTWATSRLQELTSNNAIAASYVLSLYWLHSLPWAGHTLDTALRIACSPRVLVDRDVVSNPASLAAAEHVERTLLAEGFDHPDLHSFGLRGVALGYASWSGVAYHPLDPTRSLAEDDLVSCELAVQAMWAYCEHINGQIEQGHDPAIAETYGWRFLRAARSRLTNPRPRETDQHRSMREAIVATSGLAGHLHQAIEILREAGRQ